MSQERPMGITKTEAQYRASDGASFDTKEEAERHEELVEAKREFERALDVFGKALARTHRTADGELFDIGLWKRYWIVRPGWMGMPSLTRLDSWGAYPPFRFDDTSELEVETRLGDRSFRVRVSDLYASEREAKKALLAAQEKWLREHERAVQETRDELS